MFTFDEFGGSQGTSIFGNSSSAANNTRARLPSWLSFRFLSLWIQLRFKSERHYVFTEEINKIALLSSNDDKRMQLIDSIKIFICKKQRSSKWKKILNGTM